MFKKQTPVSNQQVAVNYCRSITDDEWRRFRRAVDGYRKADKVLSGDDDGDISDLADQIIETN